MSAPQLAIVGSRNPTTAAAKRPSSSRNISRARGLTITSGLAIGIDGAGHRGALAEIGGTIAVLGGGLDVIYPRPHADLAAAIAERGLLVSEYRAGRRAAARLTSRNAIGSSPGLSLGTLVVEATRRSGSLITARCAGDFGREVFAIPGSIHNPLARGCHCADSRQAQSSSRRRPTCSSSSHRSFKVDLSRPLEAARQDDVDEARPSTRPDVSQRSQCIGFLTPVSIGDLGARCPD